MLDYPASLKSVFARDPAPGSLAKRPTGFFDGIYAVLVIQVLDEPGPAGLARLG